MPMLGHDHVPFGRTWMCLVHNPLSPRPAATTTRNRSQDCPQEFHRPVIGLLAGLRDEGSVAQPSALRFAGLLRQLRREARLTQEELAEAAGLSPRSISDLERGVNLTAHKDTALLLAGALGLGDPVH